MPPAKPEVFSITAFISAFLGFLFGLLSALIIEAVKRRREKQRLINLSPIAACPLWFVKLSSPQLARPGGSKQN